jgi:thiamine-phosphate pyrophosphorylase
MTDQLDRPQLYLITPPAFSLDLFPAQLARILDTTPVACLRLALATTDADEIARAADALREVTHARDVAIVIERHVQMVERLGLDGVHLTDSGRGLRKLRTELGADAIIGAYCGGSRHDGLAAGEAGADYIAFGPIGDTGLGDGELASLDLFQWWSEVIEIPVVAEGGLTADLVETFAPITDFFAIGAEIWRSEDPAAALTALTERMG